MTHTKTKLPFLFFLISSSLSAATWTGATSTDWNTATNWTNPATPPNASNAAALLTTPNPTNTNIDLSAATITLGTLTMDLGPPSSPYIISGGDFIFQVSSGSAAINVTNTNGNLAHQINTTSISLASALVITQNSTSEFTVSSNLSGAALTKSGTGTLFLSGTNSHSSTTISGGTLRINTDAQLGGAGNAATIGNGVLLFSTSDTTTRPFSLTGSAGINASGGVTATLSGILSGAGNLTTGGSGTIVLTNTSNSYTGGTTVSGGILSISSDSNLGDTSGALNIGSGTLQITSPLTTQRSGSISGSGSLSSAATVTFQGNFSGSGNLTFSGGGTFVLVGTNSYTGGSTVSAGTQLVGTTEGLQGNIALTSASSLLTFSQNFDGTYSGNISSSAPNAGALTKLGSGALFFSGNSSSFSGSTEVGEGALIVNGSLANSAVTVGGDGILGGLGTVGPVTTTGTIDPGSGSTIGTLTVNGAFLMNPGADTKINIAPLNSDKIAVSSTATLTGPLVIEPVSGFYGFSADYTILTSSALTPGFSSLSSTNPAFVPSILYSATTAFLHIEILEPFAAFPFSNVNTAAVGNNIDAIFSAGELSTDMRDAFNLLVGQNSDFINSVLNQLHPATYSSYLGKQTEVLSELISLFHRFPLRSCTCTNSSRIWLKPFGATLHVKSVGIQDGYQGNSGGVALGYDGEIASNWSLGIGGAWNFTHIDLQSNLGKGAINGGYGAAYTDYHWGAFYFGAAILAGVDVYDTKRHIRYLSLNRDANASFHSVDVAAQIKSAYLFGREQTFFYPYLNLDYLYFGVDSFAETGAESFNLKVLKKAYGTLRTEVGLGLHIQDCNFDQTISISPELTFGYVNMTPLQNKDYQSFFESTTISFKTEGWKKSWNLLHLDFGLSFSFNCFSFKIKYSNEFSSDAEYSNQAGNLLFDWKW